MKASLTKSQIARSSLPVHFDTIPMAFLLVIASTLAIAGGTASSTLFFGMLLLFALLVSCSRPRRSSAQQTAKTLAP
jgi:hypothetical protein